MTVRRILAVVAALALSCAVTATAVSAAQDDSKGPQPTEQAGSPGGGVLDVIPGLETQGNGNTYVLLDSTDGGGPTFNSPVYAPATVATTLDDDNFEQANLGFAFEFYGVAHATVFIGSNGYLTFNNGNTSPYNADLAAQAAVTDPGIFAFFDDLYVGDPDGPGRGGEVRYGTFGPGGSRVFVVEFDEVFRWGLETSGGTFQIRLFETTNAIEFHYFDVVWGYAVIDFGAGATVGIRAGAPGTAYLQYLENSAQINNGLAIRLWQPTCAGLDVTIVGDRGSDILTGTAGADVIHGHQGHDTIDGLGGDDTICAGGGNDLVNGWDGVDLIFGQSGHDTINGGTANDLLYGNSGNDRINGDGGGDTIIGGDGIDTIRGGTGNDALFGRGGNDRIFGDAGLDEIWGEAGFDRLFGGADKDFMNGGGQLDYMVGGDGDDTLIGEGDNDFMLGGNGNDHILGAAGADVIYGQVGNDTLRGNAGHDKMYGDAGNDILIGGTGNDWLYGRVGNDQLFGRSGNDRLYGEAGIDILFGEAGNDLLSGGAGIDTCNGGTGTDTISTCP